MEFKGIFTHSFQVKISLPAQLLLGQTRVSVAGCDVASPTRGDLVWDLQRGHILQGLHEEEI